MKKVNLSLYWLVAVLVILGLGACRSTEGENKDNQVISDISSSWSGQYAGTIPSANGREISVFLNLHSDDTFNLSYSFVGISNNFFSTRGKFEWDETKSNIILKVKNFPPYFRVEANKLILLDNNGKAITDDQAENYMLKKN